jgi:hypothetical protein
MHIDECRIVLPSGRIINLLEGDITVIHRYHKTEKVTGVPSKLLRNVRPRDIDGRKVVYIDGLASGDSVGISFDTRIPSYSTNSLILEYTQTVVWENIGEVKQRYKILFKKTTRKTYLFTV